MDDMEDIRRAWQAWQVDLPRDPTPQEQINALISLVINLRERVLALERVGLAHGWKPEDLDRCLGGLTKEDKTQLWAEVNKKFGNEILIQRLPPPEASKG